MIVNEQAVSVHLPREEEGEKEGKEECEDKNTEGEGQVKCKIAETKKGTEEAGTQTRAEEEVYMGATVKFKSLKQMYVAQVLKISSKC